MTIEVRNERASKYSRYAEVVTTDETTGRSRQVATVTKDLISFSTLLPAPALVNWSAWGSQFPAVADAFAHALTTAVALARRWDDEAEQGEPDAH